MMVNNNIKTNKSEVKEMKIESRKFRLRVWKNSNNGNCIYTIPVTSLEEASLIYNVLTLDDLIEEKMGAAPDYVNGVKLEMWSPQSEEWLEAVDEDGFEVEFKDLCNRELVNHLRQVYETGKDETIIDTDDEE